MPCSFITSAIDSSHLLSGYHQGIVLKDWLSYLVGQVAALLVYKVVLLIVVSEAKKKKLEAKEPSALHKGFYYQGENSFRFSCFPKPGFYRVTMDELAAEAGVSKRTFTVISAARRK